MHQVCHTSPWPGCQLPLTCMQQVNPQGDGLLAWSPVCWLVLQRGRQHMPTTIWRGDTDPRGKPWPSRMRYNLYVCDFLSVCRCHQMQPFPAWLSGVMKCHWRSRNWSQQTSENVCAFGALRLNISPCLQECHRSVHISLCSGFVPLSPHCPKPLWQVLQCDTDMTWDPSCQCQGKGGCQQLRDSAMGTATTRGAADGKPPCSSHPRAHRARNTAGISWQVRRALVLHVGLAQDGAGGTLLCFLADIAHHPSAPGLCLLSHRLLFGGYKNTIKKMVVQSVAVSTLFLDSFL